MQISRVRNFSFTDCCQFTTPPRFVVFVLRSFKRTRHSRVGSILDCVRLKKYILFHLKNCQKLYLFENQSV